MKKYYFESGGRRGLGYFLAFAIVLVIYLFFKDWFFSSAYAAPIFAVLIIFTVILGNLLFDRNSYLAVDEKNLTFIKHFQQKWTMPIADITSIEEYSQPLRTIEKASRHIGGRPRTGVRLTTNTGNTHEAAYSGRLVKFKSLTEVLHQKNIGIRQIPNPELQSYDD